MVETMYDSGYTSNTRRVAGDPRYDPYTTLGSAVKQAGEVQITVTFESRSRGGDPPRLSDCEMHIKSSDTSLADVVPCRIEPAGHTYMVKFRVARRQEQSFDLLALGGLFDGGAPLYYSNRFISFGLDNGRRNHRYTYVGPDPFK